MPEISRANAACVGLCFVAFWVRFVLRVRSRSSPARRVGPLRWARDALLRARLPGWGQTAESKFAPRGARLARFAAVATVGEAFS